MPERELARPVTVINRLEVKGDTGEFEDLFHAHSQYLRTRAEFDFLATMRLTEQPHVYVHLCHWHTRRALLDTMRDETFLGYVERLEPLVEAQADQAVRVRRVCESVTADTGGVALLRARVREDRTAFEERLAELTDVLADSGGFGGVDLLRSTIRPALYTGVLWWRGSRSMDRALDSARVGVLRDCIAQGADVVVERARHLAYERVLG